MFTPRSANTFTLSIAKTRTERSIILVALVAYIVASLIIITKRIFLPAVTVTVTVAVSGSKRSTTFHKTTGTGGLGQLIHVIPPFFVQDSNATALSSSFFAPLSSEQWSMLVSIQNAQQKFNRQQGNDNNTAGFHSVIVVCAVLEGEMKALNDILAAYCQQVIGLTRHTGMVYPELLSDPPHLPFIQDIVDAGISFSKNSKLDEDYHLVLTNADICVTGDFYTDLGQNMIRSNAKALSINRKVLSTSTVDITIDEKSTKSIHDAASNLVQKARDLIDKGKYNAHPGYDCFIMHSSVVNSINFGDMFVAFPYWGTNIDSALYIMAEGYRNIKSKEMSYGTFHLGNQNDWMPSKMHRPEDDTMAVWKEFRKEELKYILQCPVMGYPPQDRYTLQNAINCGKWFFPRPRNGTSQVPAFVNNGYESVFLKNFAQYLEITSEGLPIVPRKKSRSRPNARLKWIQKWG